VTAAAVDQPAIAVMYHYVRPDGAPIPGGIRPMLVSEFERQLDWLAEHYTLAHPADFLAWLDGENDARAKPPCILTFDDGTRDHAEVVTPILARRGSSGLFFVLTGPAKERLMPLTHAVHWLLGQPDDVVWSLFRHHTRDNPAALGDPGEARRIYHYESEARALIKYAANMALPVETTRRIIDAAANESGTSLEALSEEWFISDDQIRAMHAAGMTIGLHGHSHSSLQVLGPGGIRREIEHGSAYLARLTGEAPTWWACPFGGSGADDATIAAMRDACRAAGLTAAVSTRKAPARRGTPASAVPRYDCIDLPPRKPTAPAELKI
jgi:peptidoglycan/xylan/chitin deacetylase (PgdA/CDA1 family)